MFAQQSMKVTSMVTAAHSEAAHLAPRQEEPVIGRVLALRATLSPHHMQKNA